MVFLNFLHKTSFYPLSSTVSAVHSMRNPQSLFLRHPWSHQLHSNSEFLPPGSPINQISTAKPAQLQFITYKLIWHEKTQSQLMGWQPKVNKKQIVSWLKLLFLAWGICCSYSQNRCFIWHQEEAAEVSIWFFLMSFQNYSPLSFYLINLPKCSKSTLGGFF